MAISFSKIWFYINRFLTVANAFIIGMLTGRLIDARKAKEKNIPLYWNVFLLLVLLLMVLFFIYGEYRRVND